jgi:hypothetical protein
VSSFHDDQQTRQRGVPSRRSQYLNSVSVGCCCFQATKAIDDLNEQQLQLLTLALKSTRKQKSKHTQSSFIRCFSKLEKYAVISLSYKEMILSRVVQYCLLTVCGCEQLILTNAVGSIGAKHQVFHYRFISRLLISTKKSLSIVSSRDVTQTRQWSMTEMFVITPSLATALIMRAHLWYSHPIVNMNHMSNNWWKHRRCFPVSAPDNTRAVVVACCQL